MRRLFLFTLFFCLASLLAVPVAAFAGLHGTGLQISVSGDLVYDQGINDQSTAAEKLTMRGAEIMLYAPVDHKFEGVLSAVSYTHLTLPTKA